jgi:hypothetical protein
MYIISRDCGWLSSIGLREYFDIGTKTGDMFSQPKFISLYGKTSSGEKIDELIEDVLDIQVTDGSNILSMTPSVVQNCVRCYRADTKNDGCCETKIVTLKLSDGTVKTIGPVLADDFEYSVIDNVQLY